MKKKLSFLLFYLCSLNAGFFAYSPFEQKTTLPKVYSRIRDIYHPTTQDYRILQKYLNSDERDLEALKDTKLICKKIKIIGDLNNELPEFGIISNHKEIKENCIVLYSSFNEPYPNALRRLIKLIQDFDFQGDIIYRIGGWPNTAAGDLVLAPVPYAFKVCLFKEAQRLGYKRCLWLDTSMVPVVRLEEVFQIIKDRGYFAVGLASCMIGPYMNARSAAAFNLSLQETYSIPTAVGFAIGMDFTQVNGCKILESWYKAAHDHYAFYSARSDQNALSIVLYQLGCQNFISPNQIPHAEYHQPVLPDSLFVIDRTFSAKDWRKKGLPLITKAK